MVVPHHGFHLHAVLNEFVDTIREREPFTTQNQSPCRTHTRKCLGVTIEWPLRCTESATSKLRSAMLTLLRRALIVTVFGWTKYKLSLLKLLAYYPILVFLLTKEQILS